MKKNINSTFLILTLIFLIVGLTAVSATENNQTGDVETSYAINVKPSSQHIMVGIEASGMKNVFIVGECFSFGGKVEAVFADNTREELMESD